MVDVCFLVKSLQPACVANACVVSGGCILVTCSICTLLCSRIHFLRALTLRFPFKKNSKVSVGSEIFALALCQNCQIFLLVHVWPILCWALQCCHGWVKVMHLLASWVGALHLIEK